MKRKTNAVGRGKEHGRGLSEAMKCLGFRLLKFPGAGTAYRNKEMEDAVFDVVQAADEARAPTKMTGQPVTVSVYRLPDFTEPEDIREFRDLGEMFCWWYEMVAKKAKIRRPNPWITAEEVKQKAKGVAESYPAAARRKLDALLGKASAENVLAGRINLVTPMRMSITREQALVLSPMPLAQVKREGPVLVEPEGVKLFWSDKDGWSLYGYQTDRRDILSAAKRSMAAVRAERRNPAPPPSTTRRRRSSSCSR